MSLSFNGIKNLFKNRIPTIPAAEKPDRSLETSDSGSRLYHYRREQDGEKTRLHLRIDPDGRGTLIINANRVVHLNPTAALMAYFVLEGTGEDKAIRAIKKKYHVD